jgi:hypothetical protein
MPANRPDLEQSPDPCWHTPFELKLDRSVAESADRRLLAVMPADFNRWRVKHAHRGRRLAGLRRRAVIARFTAINARRGLATSNPASTGFQPHRSNRRQGNECG